MRTYPLNQDVYARQAMNYLHLSKRTANRFQTLASPAVKRREHPPADAVHLAGSRIVTNTDPVLKKWWLTPISPSPRFR
jgi:hypothetical protein